MNRHQPVFSFPAKFSSLGLMPPPLPPAPPAMVNVSIPMSAPAFPPQVAMMPTHMHIQALSAEEQKMQQQQQEQQQTVKKSSSEEEGELTPRGNHRYPKRKPWKPYRIAAWLALILAFTTVVIVVIVWGFRDTDGDKRRWVRQEHFEHMQTLLTETRNEMTRMNRTTQPLMAPRSATVMKRHNHTHVLSVSFDLSSAFAVRKFTRWPPAGQGVLKQIDFVRLVWTRLCCHVNNHMFVCDSGQGAATNVGLECIVRYSNAASEQGAYLLIYVPHEDMTGAHCSFSWQTSDKVADVNLAAPAPGIEMIKN